MSTAMSTPTVPLFVPGITSLPASLAAALYTQDASVNYYTVTCADNLQSCPLASNWVLTEGPSTVQWTDKPDATGSTSVGCVISGSTSAQCTGLTIASGSTVSTTYATAVSYHNVALTSVGNGIKLPAVTSGPAASGNSSAPAASGSAASGSAGAAGSSSSSHAAAAPMATGMVGLTGAMAAFAVVVGAL